MPEFYKRVEEILGRIGLTDASGDLVGLTTSNASIELNNLINSNPAYATQLGFGAAGTEGYNNSVRDWIAATLLRYESTLNILKDMREGTYVPPGTTGEGQTFDEYMAGIGAPQTLAQYGATAPGQEDIMSAGLARQLGPTPTPFLQAAGERLFDPIQAGYTLGSGLGQLPGQMAPGTEWSPSALTGERPAPTFSQYLGTPGVLPTQQALQSQVAQAASLFGPQPADAPLGEAQQGFVKSLQEDIGKQYTLALSSVLQNMPIHLRAPYTRWAQDQFRKFRGTSPEQHFLPQFVGTGDRATGGFSFGR
jgi:hypothetical protein